MEKQRIQKENQDIRDDDTTSFSIQIELLDDTKAKNAKNHYSRNELATEDHRNFKTTENKKQ